MKPRYPNTPIIPVIDQIHGHSILDNYRWLEDIDSPNTQKWIEEQNQLTRSVLDRLPFRKRLVERLQNHFDIEKVDSPKVYQDRVFYLRRKPGQNQPVLYYRLEHETEDQEKVVVDPNMESEEGIISLDWWYPSEDGQLIAYGLSEGGNEWSILHLKNVDTGELLSDQIPRTRYTSVVWDQKNGFYYNRYPEPGEFPSGEENYHVRLFYHKIGTNWKDDPIIFGNDLPMKSIVWARLSKDKQYMFIYVRHGWSKNDIYVSNFIQDKLNFVPIVKDLDCVFYGELNDNILYFLTNYNAPNYKVIAVKMNDVLQRGLNDPDSWETIIPEDKTSTIEEFRIARDKIILHITKDVSSYLKVYDLHGTYLNDITLPSPGSVSNITLPGTSENLYLMFQSFFTPPGVYRLDMDNFQLIPFAGGNSENKLSDFTIEQVFYKSKDGTEIPMFILHKSDLKLDGHTPTVLNGYGGFNVISGPVYSPAIFPWLENGGVFALANLRGGGEYGDHWHRGGMRENKQNVFDDFIYAAKFLISKGYTDPNHLGIHGRSNGGLLVGAALTQEPSLFKAVACGVPLLDMLRFHKFLIGALWTDEYGSPDVLEEFQWLYDYSPYHHIKEGENYPAVFFYTAASDSRVHPLHALKMTASLQRATGSERPILLNVEFDAGHGIGKPITKLVDEQADIWSFMAWQLELNIT